MQDFSFIKLFSIYVDLFENRTFFNTVKLSLTYLITYRFLILILNLSVKLPFVRAFSVFPQVFEINHDYSSLLLVF